MTESLTAGHEKLRVNNDNKLAPLFPSTKLAILQTPIQWPAIPGQKSAKNVPDPSTS
ncbi:hypothetical protein PGTUg99_032567 [Puccinia graminis f. sp. tritici]|uniref:Uncharacterized protein n=1 Tax=Puccinia graminis f. sp. tritici TaxID=56615 RepID=A0A5B0SK50_PUCGR|nr:hypothetical protein PGTUg99_032567 [Puccinia graminis f. sp. tritici]